MSKSFSIYGLRIRANRCIPGLTAAPDTDPPDVEIDFGASLPCSKAGMEARHLQFDSGDGKSHLPPSVRVWRFEESGAYHFIYRDGIEFMIDDSGGKISAACNGSATLEDAVSYLVGVILGFVLRLKGRAALHASVVDIEGRAVVLLGDAGSGKSTTAAAFAMLGHGVLADDVCAPVEHAGRFWVEPAYPGIRLWPDAVNAIFGARDALPRISPAWDKRLLDLSRGAYQFRSNRLPVGAFYLLRPVSGVEEAMPIKRLRGPELLMKLVAMSYPHYLLDKRMKATQFGLLSRLAAAAPGVSLSIREEIASVPDICRAIVDDVCARAA